jgi:ATP-dependent DNA helicase RecQ
MLACPDDVPTLENFAYGDTPSERALRGLVAELVGKGSAFDVALTDLSERHDLRILVLRTALTYLELLGVLKQGTPYYAGYAIKPKTSPEEIASHFQGEPATFIRDLFKHAKRGRTWFRIDPDDVAAKMKQDRARIIRAVDVLETRGHAEVTASDVRQRYTLTRPAAELDVDALARDLSERFARREEQEIARVAEVMKLVEEPGCHTNALVAHFGEIRAEPCGHCVPCLTGRARAMPTVAAPAPLPGNLDVGALAMLRDAHPEALAEPRQVARLLCGLGSPALTRAKLTRHPLSGALEERSFREVLAWCERLFGGEG